MKQNDLNSRDLPAGRQRLIRHPTTSSGFLSMTRYSYIELSFIPLRAAFIELSVGWIGPNGTLLSGSSIK